MIYLPLPKFARGLQVQDEDGRLLNFLPNSVVDEILAELKTGSPTEFSHFEHRFKHVEYKLAVLLPDEAPLKPQSVRTIRLCYPANEPAKLYGVLGSMPAAKKETKLRSRIWRQWVSRVFSIPYNEIAVARFEGHNHDHFVVIDGMADHVLYAVDTVDGNEPQKLYRNGLDGEDRVASVRLPPAEKGPYRWKIVYDQRPAGRGRLATLSLFLIATVLVALLGWCSFLTGNWPLLSSPALVVGFGASTLGLMTSLENPSEDRFRVLLALPLLAQGALAAALLV